jgi:hypothetical protein
LGADFGGGLFKRASHDSKECGAFCFCTGLSPNQKWSLLTIREREYPSRLSDGRISAKDLAANLWPSFLFVANLVFA